MFFCPYYSLSFFSLRNVRLDDCSVLIFSNFCNILVKFIEILSKIFKIASTLHYLLKI